jgi:sugar lactone lactonase YvrE
MKLSAPLCVFTLLLVGSAFAADTAPAPAAAAPTASAPKKSAPRKFAIVPISNPRSVAVDAAGNLYVGDVDAGTIHKITPAGEVSVIGNASIKDPIGLAVGAKGRVVVADADGNGVYQIAATGAVTALGQPAAGSATSPFTTPTSVAVDRAGNVFVTDNGNNAIRKVAADGTVTTFAGKGGAGGSADGKGDAARFSTPRGLAIDGKDNLYVADEGNSNIRKITPEGVVSTLAGGAGQTGSNDGTGTAAHFASPRGLAADAAGNVYVADTDNHTIRKITPAGVVTTLAGKPGDAGSANGKGAEARFSEPRSAAVDAEGNVFVADTGNATIRMITPDGVVTTVAAAAKP